MSFIRSRLRRAEARVPPAPPEEDSPKRSQRVREFIERYEAWGHAGYPDTEEGREVQAMVEEFKRWRRLRQEEGGGGLS